MGKNLRGHRIEVQGFPSTPCVDPGYLSVGGDARPWAVGDTYPWPESAGRSALPLFICASPPGHLHVPMRKSLHPESLGGRGLADAPESLPCGFRMPQDAPICLAHEVSTF